MTGGHFLMVGTSSPLIGLKAFCGKALNQSGRPRTAGMGRGRIPSSSGGQRKTMHGCASLVIVVPLGRGSQDRFIRILRRCGSFPKEGGRVRNDAVSTDLATRSAHPLNFRRGRLG